VAALSSWLHRKILEWSFLKPNKGAITIYGVRRYYNGEFAKDYYHRGVDYAGAVVRQ